MPLDPHAKRLLSMLAASGAATVQLAPAAMRRAMQELAQAVDAKNVTVGACEDRLIPGPGGSLPVRVYTPAGPMLGSLPGLIYFHGGTGVFCSIDTHDGLCRLLANESGCRVVSVGYRLAPENKFPAALEDARAAARWIFVHATDLAIDPTRIAIGGDSAGATLATVVCRLEAAAGHKFALQVLFCPVTDVKGDTQSRRAFAHGYFFDIGTLDWALGHYLPPGTDVLEAEISPLRSRDLRGLAPAHIHTAEFDPFRDEGKAYADVLENFGVPVRRWCHEGMIHHFYCMAGIIPRSRQIIKIAGEAMQQALLQPDCADA